MSILASYIRGAETAAEQVNRLNAMASMAEMGQAPSPMAQMAQSGREFDWSPYLVGGATRDDAISGLDPRMRGATQAFLSAADAELGPGLQVYSAYRSPERQAELYEGALARYGSPEAARKWVAPPGRSQHNRGRAVDLKFGGVRLDQAEPRVRDWVRSNAPRFGLAVPMDWEPWQVELAGARSNPMARMTQ